MPPTRDTFNELMGELDYPMFIVTAAHGGERAGCLVGFATERIGAGDHVGFVLEPIAAERRHRDGQFPFHRAKRIEPGHPA